jgi:4-amino-4-deoxy-L-arabinose transferase-like glycosyltransferase
MRRLAAVHWSTWALIVITLLGLALRLAVVWNDRGVSVPYGARTDSGTYLGMAQQWSTKQVPIAGNNANYFFTPGYPAFLGFLMRVRLYLGIDSSIRVLAGLVQAVLGTWVVLMIGLLARKRFSPLIGTLAALTYAIWKSHVWGTTTLMTEPLFTPILWTAITIYMWSEKPSLRALWWTGFLLGIATLVRPAAAPVIVGCLVLIYFRNGREFNWGMCKKFLGGVAVVLMPWFILTIATTGRPLLTTTTGFNFCLGNSDGATGTYRQDVCQIPPGAEVASGDQQLQLKALKWAVNHPSKEYELLWKRNDYIWDQGDAYFSYADGMGEVWDPSPDRQHQIDAANRFWTVAVQLSVVGLVIGFCRFRTYRQLAFLGFSMLVMAYVTFGDSRFHDPVIPLMAITIAILLESPLAYGKWYVRQTESELA